MTCSSLISNRFSQVLPLFLCVVSSSSSFSSSSSSSSIFQEFVVSARFVTVPDPS